MLSLSKHRPIDIDISKLINLQPFLRKKYIKGNVSYGCYWLGYCRQVLNLHALKSFITFYVRPEEISQKYNFERLHFYPTNSLESKRFASRTSPRLCPGPMQVSRRPPDPLPTTGDYVTSYPGFVPDNSKVNLNSSDHFTGQIMSGFNLLYMLYTVHSYQWLLYPLCIDTGQSNISYDVNAHSLGFKKCLCESRRGRCRGSTTPPPTPVKNSNFSNLYSKITN